MSKQVNDSVRSESEEMNCPDHVFFALMKRILTVTVTEYAWRGDGQPRGCELGGRGVDGWMGGATDIDCGRGARRLRDHQCTLSAQLYSFYEVIAVAPPELLGVFLE